MTINNLFKFSPILKGFSIGERVKFQNFKEIKSIYLFLAVFYFVYREFRELFY